MGRVIAIVLVGAVVLAACGKTSKPAAAKTVTASLSEWQIGVDHDTAASGDVKFTVRNTGAEVHELVIFKTDLEAGKLPTEKDDSVNEEGKGVEHLTEVEDVGPGKSNPLTATLDPGKYVLICNRVDKGKVHYKLGMRTALTVE